MREAERPSNLSLIRTSFSHQQLIISSSNFHMSWVSLEGPALRLMRLDRGLRVPLQLIGSKQRTALPTRGTPHHKTACKHSPLRDRSMSEGGVVMNGQPWPFCVIMFPQLRDYHEMAGSPQGQRVPAYLLGCHIALEAAVGWAQLVMLS